MKYMLDTCVMLFWLSNPNRLNKKTQNLIETEEIYFSVVSIWEMAIKKKIGRLEMPENILDIINAKNIFILDIKGIHVLGTIDLPDIHNDPFDRLLVSVAKLEDMVLITSDKMILQYPINTLKT